MMSIPANLARIRNEIADACARAGRNEDAVALMAVSKMHPAASIAEAYAAGVRLFGENKVQEWDAKISALPEEILHTARFHLIGHLQSNKSARAAALFASIDTVDSLKLAERLNAAAATLDRRLPVLIEVKLSSEDSKHGISPGAVSEILHAAAALPALELRGLMTVPPFFDDSEDARPYFKQLRELRDSLNAVHPHTQLVELSMGMSHDFAVAIEEGSTCVRIGTALFGKRSYAQA